MSTPAIGASTNDAMEEKVHIMPALETTVAIDESLETPALGIETNI